MTSIDYTDSYTSNKSDVIYINFELFKKMSSAYQTTAHELQHLYRFNFMNLRNPDSLWINEGSSDYIASEVYGPLSNRVTCFNGNACRYGVNNKSIFDRTGDVRLYSFRYAFMSYLYHISSKTKEQREDFFYEITTGKDRQENQSVRANNAEKLFTAFKEASQYDGTLLGTAYKDIFYKLYSSFVLQTASFEFSDNIKKGKKGLTNTEVDFTNVISKYPLPSFFQQKTGNQTALKIPLYSYSDSFFKNNDRSGNVSYFAVLSSANKVFQPKDNLMVFSLKNAKIPRRAYPYDIYLKINYSMKSQGSTIQPSLTSLDEISPIKKENNFFNENIESLISNLSDIEKDHHQTSEHDHHFGCIYGELQNQFLLELHQNQVQFLSD